MNKNYKWEILFKIDHLLAKKNLYNTPTKIKLFYDQNNGCPKYLLISGLACFCPTR